VLFSGGHAQVDAGGLDAFMAHKVSQQGDVIVFCQEILRETVPEGVGIDHFRVYAIFYERMLD